MGLLSWIEKRFVGPAKSVGGSRGREGTEERRGNVREREREGARESGARDVLGPGSLRAAQGRLDVPTGTVTEEAMYFTSSCSVSLFPSLGRSISFPRAVRSPHDVA